ncbi:hypothetical protein [Calothrix sp. PCC 6303]|uniref:hypothetical protein n=1 Tax=Calothrix sp. PCC 6303 TaxID=1170562 RepID=UPI0002A02D3A|nr:hypothetical protein [Calothrix sp. PCC 6303]AFZ01987.1 hypothetical protein Cal6303_3040 [Calothrix sp. PCC 6303]
MSLSALRKFVLIPAIASAAVFSAMSLPLALFGDKPVNIRFEEEPIFDGRLRDIAPPYVVLITTLSLGAGISAAAISGWRSSSRRSIKFKNHLSTLEQHLEEKEQMLKEMKLSDSRIQVNGLRGFLDEELSFEQAIAQNNLPINVSQPVVAQALVSVDQPSVSPTYQQVPSKTTNDAISGFALAQPFLSYPQHSSNKSLEKAKTSKVEDKATLKSDEIAELQKQLHLMMDQMLQMQQNLESSNKGMNSQVNFGNKFSVYYEAPEHQEISFK